MPHSIFPQQQFLTPHTVGQHQHGVRDGGGVGGGIMIVCGGVTKVRWKKGWEGEITVGEKKLYI